MANTRWVTTLSIFSLRVGSPGAVPRSTEAATTFWMYWYRLSAMRVSRSPRSLEFSYSATRASSSCFTS